MTARSSATCSTLPSRHWPLRPTRPTTARRYVSRSRMKAHCRSSRAAAMPPEKPIVPSAFTDDATRSKTTSAASKTGGASPRATTSWPETSLPPLLRWHRAGFRRYWRWKSRSLGGRPQLDADLRALIRRMSLDNLLWGARAFMASCSSSALRSPASQSTWSSDVALPPRGSTLLRPLAMTCSMSLSLFDWPAETLSGPTSHRSAFTPDSNEVCHPL
jgi:hypothetical protein